MSEFLAEINWSPLWISLKTGFTATVIAFFLGIFFARLVMKMKPFSRGILDGILTMPLVLPPTVAGFILLLLFSLRRPFGAFLLDNFDIKIVQTWKGCVIAASVIAFPLMYRNARAAFEQVDVNLIAAGKTLGMSDRRIFWTVVMRQQDPESHPVQSLPLPEQSENTVLHPCSQETFLARPEPFPLPLLRRLRQEIMAWPVSG